MNLMPTSQRRRGTCSEMKVRYDVVLTYLLLHSLLSFISLIVSYVSFPSFFYLSFFLFLFLVWKTESWANEQSSLQNKMDKSANPVLTVAIITKIRNDLFKISRYVRNENDGKV